MLKCCVFMFDVQHKREVIFQLQHSIHSLNVFCKAQGERDTRFQKTVMKT